jgi:hypothetical protein
MNEVHGGARIGESRSSGGKSDQHKREFEYAKAIIDDVLGTARRSRSLPRTTTFTARGAWPRAGSAPQALRRRRLVFKALTIFSASACGLLVYALRGDI